MNIQPNNSYFYKLLFAVVFAASIFGCGGGGKSSGDAFNEISKSDSTGQINEATSELAMEVIKSIPPPVEMSAIIKNSGEPYTASILNNPDNYEKYNTNYLKAINLGIYGADMGYINIYNHKEDALTYLSTVIKLAEDLKIGQFFDFETIKRIADNNKNLDSLVNITTSNFEKMNTYLQEQNRSNISLYMLIGGWLEALNIAVNVALMDNNELLYEKIGEQKIVLDQIMLLLSFYKNDPNALMISKELDLLKKTYNEVKIETIYAEPTMVVENGALVVKDNSKTNIIISVDTVKKIHEIVTKIRNKVIS